MFGKESLPGVHGICDFVEIRWAEHCVEHPTKMSAERRDRWHTRIAAPYERHDSLRAELPS